MKKETQSTVGPMVEKETERKENRAVGVALVGVAAAVGVAVAAAVAPKVMHEQRTEVFFWTVISEDSEQKFK